MQVSSSCFPYSKQTPHLFLTRWVYSLGEVMISLERSDTNPFLHTNQSDDSPFIMSEVLFADIEQKWQCPADIADVHRQANQGRTQTDIPGILAVQDRCKQKLFLYGFRSDILNTPQFFLQLCIFLINSCCFVLILTYFLSDLWDLEVKE